MNSYVLDHKANQNPRHTALRGNLSGPVSQKWSYLPMRAWENKAVSLLVGQAEEWLVFVQTRLKEGKVPPPKGARVCTAGDSILKKSCWMGNCKGQSCLSVGAAVSSQSSCVQHSLQKRKAEVLTPGLQLGGKVLVVCLSQLRWEPVFGVKCAREVCENVGRNHLCYNQQLEKAVWVSSVSGLFPLILLLGAHSDKPSFSVLDFRAVVCYWKIANLKTFECPGTLP